MLTQNVKRLDNQDRLLYWITEREKVRRAREAGAKPPWTDDEILANYRFCNVHRMDDRVSQWLLHNWYTPNKDHPNMLLACVLARHFNLPEALEAIGFPKKWEPDRMKAVLLGRKARGLSNFNGAYIVRADGKYPDKSTMVVDETTQQFVTNPPELNTDRMMLCVETLTRYRNIGSFMAGQITADLRWAMSGKWKDRLWWAPMGPGSKRGMNRLHGRSINQPLSQARFVEELGDVILACKESLGGDITDRLEAIDYQNCMCEYDKYERCLWGGGRSKSGYRPSPW